MYHLLKGLHEYLTRSGAPSTRNPPRSHCYISQEGRVFRHYHWPRWRGQDGARSQQPTGSLPIPFRFCRLSLKRSRRCIMTRQASRQTRSPRLWARTVRDISPLLPRSTLTASSLFVIHAHISYSREDIPAVCRAPILGSRRPTRDPVHLAEVLRRLPRCRLCRRCGRPRATQRRLGSLRYVFSLFHLPPSGTILENDQRLKNATRAVSRHGPLGPTDPWRPAPPASKQAGQSRVTLRRGDSTRL